MGRILRVFTVFFAATLFAISSRAAAIDDILPDASTLAQMEARAIQAKPREQCFLYTELVHHFTEIAGREMLAGNVENAAAALKRVHRYADLIHAGLSDDAKRLMNSQMLMHHTTRRLGEFVRKASFEDREAMESTLKHLTAVEDELLVHVFAH